jgi:hypothetical protein
MGEKAYQISRELDINNHLIKILEIYNKLIKKLNKTGLIEFF